MGKSGLGCCNHFVHGCIRPGIADVVGNGVHEKESLLGHNPDVAPQIFKGNVFDIDTIDGDFPFGDIIKPCNQIDDGGFSRAGSAHQADHLACAHIGN